MSIRNRFTPGVSSFAPITRRSRRGISLLWIGGSLAAIGVVAALVVPRFMKRTESTNRAEAMIFVVQRATFEHSIIEPGEVESSNNVEVRCQVQARGSTGTVILEIVPAATVVQEGDVLIKFDSSALENERTQQQIVCNNSKALVIQSQNVFDTAVIAKQEYLEGTYKQEEQTVQSEVFVAEENLRRSEEYARYSERLAARGYTTAVQVEADKFAVEKARKDVDTTQSKLRVLREFTRKKFENQLEADIRTAEAKLQADQSTHKLDNDKLALISAQVDKCIVKAPSAGKVIYANESDRRGNAEVIIQEGAIIRERQTVIRLPDLTKMQVKAKINESRIGFIRVGMPTTVRLDAFPDLALDGVVTRVDEYPVPPGFMSSNIKQYATFVQINELPDGVRPGLTSQVEIHIDQQPDALAVPVQAIYEHDDAYYCLVQNGNRPEAHWVDVGTSNEQTIVIRSGLNPGDEVIINPDRFADKVEFPAPPPDKVNGHKKPLVASAAKTGLAPGENTGGPAANLAGVTSPDGKSGSGKSGAGKPGGGKSGDAKAYGGKSGRDPVEMVRETFARYDLDKDGSLSQNEIPDDRRDGINRSDSNGDGRIDRAEMTAAMNRLSVNRAEGSPTVGLPFGGGAQ